jgi:hypothetical protein
MAAGPTIPKMIAASARPWWAARSPRSPRNWNGLYENGSSEMFFRNDRCTHPVTTTTGGKIICLSLEGGEMLAPGTSSVANHNPPAGTIAALNNDLITGRSLAADAGPAARLGMGQNRPLIAPYSRYMFRPVMITVIRSSRALTGRRLAMPPITLRSRVISSSGTSAKGMPKDRTIWE